MRVAHSSQTLPWAHGSSTMLPGMSRHTTQGAKPHCHSGRLFLLDSLGLSDVVRPTTCGATSPVAGAVPSSMSPLVLLGPSCTWLPGVQSFVALGTLDSGASQLAALDSTSVELGLAVSSDPGSTSARIVSWKKFSPSRLNSKRLRGPEAVTSSCCWSLEMSIAMRLALWQLKQMKMRPCTVTCCMAWQAPHCTARMPSGGKRLTGLMASSFWSTR
mmetsp:Transcript_2358/g.4663  ORF Transcript_2358/g.4663 Transcript_2358/m.4663 type:complete len:216 (-) Transcript_2358:480-1127(-)